MSGGHVNVQKFEVPSGPPPCNLRSASYSSAVMHVISSPSTALSVLILGAVFAERQEAMLDLGRSQRHFARAFHANPSAVSMIASDGRVLDVNERWCRLFGHPPGRAVGATIEALGLDVDPGDPASIRFCHKVGLDYVSCSPFRVPIARLAAAHAALRD